MVKVVVFILLYFLIAAVFCFGLAFARIKLAKLEEETLYNEDYIPCFVSSVLWPIGCCYAAYLIARIVGVNMEGKKKDE